MKTETKQEPPETNPSTKSHQPTQIDSINDTPRQHIRFLQEDSPTNFKSTEDDRSEADIRLQFEELEDTISNLPFNLNGKEQDKEIDTIKEEIKNAGSLQSLVKTFLAEEMKRKEELKLQLEDVAKQIDQTEQKIKKRANSFKSNTILPEIKPTRWCEFVVKWFISILLLFGVLLLILSLLPDEHLGFPPA